MAAAPEDVAAVSGRIVDWSGDRLDFGAGILTFDGHAFQRDFGRPLGEVRLPGLGDELLFACGGNMLIRKQAFLEAGGFDESYFAYLEDVDLGWRLWAGGQRVTFAPAAVVHHRSMATSQLLGNANRGFLFERNAYLTAYKNFEPGLWEKVMPAILLTLQHRTQTLLVQSNPGGEQLTYDPYAGLIANTAKREVSATESEGAGAGEPTAKEVASEGAAKAASPSQVLSQTPLPQTTLAEKWRGYGPTEFFRRGLRKALGPLLPTSSEPEPPRISDGRTVAQLRAITYILGNLDQAAASRQRVQVRRQRGDLEIFRRFPLHIVPTYPGDERLFASAAFRAWLPADLPVAHCTLAEIMHLGD